MVNPLQGTNSHYDYSNGNTLPLVTTPWGMTNWAPQTRADDDKKHEGWWFQYSGTHVNGIRATRQPSPWMGDYGQFVLMPQTGPVALGRKERESAYDVDASTFRPDYLKLHLQTSDITIELTASERCAVMRMTFPESAKTGRLIIDAATPSHLEIEGRTIRGYTSAAKGGVPSNFRAYFVIRLDRDLVAGDEFVEFSTASQRVVEAVIGTSFIGYEQAERSMAREASDGFDAVRTRTAAQWESHLSKLAVEGGTEEQRRTFHSCHYRALLFPHKLYELGENDQPTHYSPYDGQVHAGVLYGDIGFWDVYRTNFPFLSIVYPEQLVEILEGFVQAYRESGWFPQWPSPGHRGCMIGSHIDAVIADAVVKGISGFDVKTAYEGLRKNAFEIPPNETVGRTGFEHYRDRGYVPAQNGKAAYTVSSSLDYAYDDWCVAQVAKVLGHEDDHDFLLNRSKSYANLWDPSVGFFRPKNPDGTWFGAFDEFAWSAGYVEGGAWQCTWAVPHDPEGLAALMGGRQAMLAKLDRMLGLPPIFHVGEYGQVIHEMTEMANASFGQYAHSNQPVHHVLCFFAALGQPWKTEYWTRRVCQDLYDSTPDGFAGDEDNGEMACWYLLSAIGLFPLCVGDPSYTLTSPLFDRVTVQLPDGKTLIVRAENQSEHNHYAQSRTLNGQPFTDTTIPHARIMQGGEMVVTLGPQPPR